MNLFLIVETYTNGFISIFLDILFLISIIFGILTIISKNPIVSVLFLIFLFSSVSIYLISMGMYFIGISYLLVYVGAVSILFIFILMLVNIRISELLSPTGNSIPLAVIIIISFYFSLAKVISYNTTENYNFILNYIKNFNDYSNFFSQVLNDNKGIYYATSKNWEGTLAESTDITTLGNIMYSSYSIWLLLTSLILLLAMIGSIVITIK